MKRLIVCLDGTWNVPDAGPNPTNVVKIMRAIRDAGSDGAPQVTFYDKGVGTGGPIDRIRGGAFGRGLDTNVQDGYRFLCNNYVPGDEIYLFGFSRGAFTARSLAGFIGWMGLLEKSAMARLPEAWQSYKDHDEALRAELRAVHGRAEKRAVRIRCVGVWDTVGALGIPGKLGNSFTRGKYRFHDTQLGDHIDFGFHALSIDERRGPFEPTLWSTLVDNDISTERVRQVWFPGVHSNVGGGYRDAGLSDLALDWMIGEVSRATDLVFDRGYCREQVSGDPEATLCDSLSMYWISRAIPYLRVMGGASVERAWPVRWLGRWLERSNRPPAGEQYVNEMLHWSALARLGKDAPWQHGDERRMRTYRPANLRAARDALPVVQPDGSIVTG